MCLCKAQQFLNICFGIRVVVRKGECLYGVYTYCFEMCEKLLWKSDAGKGGVGGVFVNNVC